jgi:hypothetical protein
MKASWAPTNIQSNVPEQYRQMSIQAPPGQQTTKEKDQ